MFVRRMSLALALAGLVVGTTPSAEAAHSSFRLQIEPSDADVYLSGQHMGQVSDFDGLLQRLTVKPGEREIVLFREGYRTVRQTLDLPPGAEQKIRYAMEPLPEGETAAPPPAFVPKEPVGAVPKLALAGSTGVEAVAKEVAPSGFGVIALNIKPRPDEVLIDGEAWPLAPQAEQLLFHLGAGKRGIELRKGGYETFRTEVLVVDGKRVELNVSLPKR